MNPLANRNLTEDIKALKEELQAGLAEFDEQLADLAQEGLFVPVDDAVAICAKLESACVSVRQAGRELVAATAGQLPAPASEPEYPEILE